LTQFLLWMVLSTVLISGAQMAVKTYFGKADTGGQSIEQAMSGSQIAVPGEAQEEAAQFNQAAMDDVMKSFSSINFAVIIGSFLFYFLGGYLLYSAFSRP
jgi:ABC-2 type transport system permease protein